MKLTTASMLAMAMLIGGCAIAPAPRNTQDPKFLPSTPLSPDRPAVALVLSGGAARGFAHVGVIKVLEANGLRPDIIVGSSAGSIVGALYASGLTAAELERALGELDLSAFSDWVVPGLFFPGPMGFVQGEKLHRFIDERTLHHLIDDFPIRFAAVATDMNTGEVAIFNSGDAGLAVRASGAVPGLITPARIAGRLYADGQIASPLPVSAARALGARIVVAVDVLYPPEDARVNSIPRALFQSFIIAAYRLKEWEIKGADAVIAPVLPRTAGQMGFAARERLIAAGEEAARAALERLRPLFAEPRRRH